MARSLRDGDEGPAYSKQDRISGLSLAPSSPLHRGSPRFRSQLFGFVRQQARNIVQNRILQPYFRIRADQGFPILHKVTVTLWTNEITPGFFKIKRHVFALQQYRLSLKSARDQKPRSVRISANVLKE